MDWRTEKTRRFYLLYCIRKAVAEKTNFIGIWQGRQMDGQVVLQQGQQIDWES